MADYYKYNTDTGIITVDTSTLKTDVQGEYKAALGSDLELTDSTPQGRMIDGETAARSGVLAFTSEIANQINPDQAGGVFLGSIFSLMGGEPYKATVTVINNMRVYGTQNGVVAGGFQVYDPNGSIFTLQTNITMNQEDTTTTPHTWYGLGIFQATVTGPLVVPANTQWFLSTPAPLNVTHVTNPEAGIPGANAETDVAARNRRRNTLAKQGRNSVRAIRALVSDLLGFRSMVIRENTADSSQTIDGITMPANSIYVCVQGAVDDDIAEAMLEAKSTGAPWTVGSPVRGTQVTVTLTEPASGQPYTITFARPTIIPCTCNVEYDAAQSTGNYEPQFAIQDAIMKYQNGELPGDPGLVVSRNLSAYELAGAIGALYPGIYVSNLTVTGKSTTSDEIVMNLWEVANIPIGGVIVTPR